MTRALSVWWDRVVVGTLQINQHGEMRFTYTSEWLADASRPPSLVLVAQAGAILQTAPVPSILRRTAAGGVAARCDCRRPWHLEGERLRVP